MNRMILLLLLVVAPKIAAGQSIAYNEKKGFKDLNTFIYEARFSPFRNYFAITYGDSRMELYDRNWRKIYEHQGNPASNAGNVVFSPDEEYLVLSRYKSATDIVILRLEDLKIVKILSGLSGIVMDITYSHMGDFIASAGFDGTISVWSTKGEKFDLVNQFNDHRSVARSVSFSYDDHYLASCGDENKIFIYEIMNDRIQLHNTLTGARGYINKVLFHPTELKMVSRTSEYIHVWKIKQDHFEKYDSLKLYSTPGNGMAFSPVGDYLVSGSSKVARILKMHSGSIEEAGIITRHSLPYEEGEVFQVQFSEDGQFLTTSSADKTAYIWEVTGVQPSLRSILAGYLNNKMSLAQKRVLTGDALTEIYNKLDAGIKAPKDEFETTEQFNLRRRKLAETTLLYLQDYIEKAYSVEPASGGNVKFPIQELIGYNADKEIYKIRFLDTEGGVDIPVDPARSFKDTWQRAYIQAWKFKDPNTIAYDYSDFQLVHPGSGRTYRVTPVENPFLLKSDPEIMKGPADNATEAPVESVMGSEHRITRALLFATDVYDSFIELTNPILDANTMASELAMNYGTIVEVVENPTLNETMKKIREYATYAYGEGDQLLIFFAGHGVYDEVFKEGYVISRDSESGDETKTSYLSHSNLRTIVNNIPCSHIFLVMDVCFGGTFDPLLASSTRSAGTYEEVSVEDFIERKSRYKTRLYLTSGGKEYVPDGRPGHHSPFMRKFLEALRNYGGNDGITTVNEILQYVERVEPQPRFGEFGDNEPGSDFLLILKN